MADDLFTTRATTQRTNLVADTALFAIKFPFIDIAYTDSYLTDINTAVNFPRDGEVITDIKSLTDDVATSMEEGRKALSTLFKYAYVAYPDNKVKQRVFGQDRMDKARNDQEKMTRLLRHANGFADKDPYKTALTTIGYDQTLIDNLKSYADNIELKNGLQESAIASRPVSTQGRINVHNIVYKRMKLVSVLAQVVFENDIAKIHQYQVYPISGPDNTGLIVHIVHTGTTNPFVGLTVKLLLTPPLETSTDASGNAQFALGATPPTVLNIEVSGTGVTTTTFNNKPITAGVDNVIELEM